MIDYFVGTFRLRQFGLITMIALLYPACSPVPGASKILGEYYYHTSSRGGSRKIIRIENGDTTFAVYERVDAYLLIDNVILVAQTPGEYITNNGGSRLKLLDECRYYSINTKTHVILRELIENLAEDYEHHEITEKLKCR